MTRRAAEELWDALCALREPLIALSVTVWEDRPENDEVMLADSLGDAVVEACGWLEEAIAAVRGAGDTSDAAALRDPLVACGRQLDRLERTFWSDIASYERLDEVVGLGRERTSWSGWASGVRRSIDDCCSVIHDVRAALLATWRELTSQHGPSLVTVNTTSIGQVTSATERA